MKKQILLSAIALCAMSANAQLQFNKESANAGFTGKGVITEGVDYYMSHTFNSNVAYGAKLNDSNAKGVGAMAITSEDLDSNQATVLSGDMKTVNTGSTFKVVRFKDVQALRDSFSVASASSIDNNFWKYGCVLLDVPNSTENDQAFALYPGMAKRGMFGFQIKAQDMGGLTSDISFDLMTLDKGNTGKAKSIKMIVDFNKQPFFPWINALYSKTGDDTALLDSISAANIDLVNTALGSNLKVVDDIYTTTTEDGIAKKSINLAEVLGMTPGQFNGKKITVIFYMPSSGTAVQPGMYEPIVGLDNIYCTYGKAVWESPVVVAEQRVEVKQHCEANTETEIKFNLKDKNRCQDLIIRSDGDNKTSANFYFKETGCVFAKNAATGEYTVPVEYTYTPVAGTEPLQLSIAGSITGDAVEDDLMVVLYANIPAGQRAYSLEVTNGTRFFYDIVAGPNVTASASERINPAFVSAQDGKIIVANNSAIVTVSNIEGQKVAEASAEVAAKGLEVNAGAYIVKAGETVAKVVVK